MEETLREEEEEREGERDNITVIPFSKNRIHLLVPFSAKEMMNSAASRPRFYGGRGAQQEPPGAGLAPSQLTSFLLVMMWETEKYHLSVSLESVILEKAPEGHTEESNRKNSEILENLGQNICRKIIPSRLGGGGKEEASESTGPFSPLPRCGQNS